MAQALWFLVQCRRSRLCFVPLAALAAITLLPPALFAAPVTFTDFLNFRADESIWGPGSSRFSFGDSDSIGSSALGVSYDVGANTGTVSARFAGSFRAMYDDTVPFGSAAATPIGLNFLGTSGNLTTELGAHVDIDGSVLGIDFGILNRDYRLDVDDDFTSRFASPVASGSDSVSIIALGVGPNIVVASVSAGVLGNIREEARLNTTGILGHLVSCCSPQHWNDSHGIHGPRSERR
jgi:hypothetical protein